MDKIEQAIIQDAEALLRHLQNEIEHCFLDVDAISHEIRICDMPNDGTNVCELSLQEQAELTDGFIASGGDFASLVTGKKTSTLEAIGVAASTHLRELAREKAINIMSELVIRFQQDSSQRFRSYKKVYLHYGRTCGMDFFQASRIAGNIEEYRNIEGIGNDVDIYRYNFGNAHFIFSCDLRQNKESA